MMVHTGLEHLSDNELWTGVDRSDDPLTVESFRRFLSALEEVGDREYDIKCLNEKIAELSSGKFIAELQTKLDIAEDRITDMEQIKESLERQIRSNRSTFDRREKELQGRIAELEKRIRDAPATW